MPKTCNDCGMTRHLNQFGNFTKNGKTYKNGKCKICRSRYEKERMLAVRRKEWLKVINWAIPMLVLVTGIYSHDMVDGSIRTCFYTSVYGTHAASIDSMNMCPMTMEFEV